MSQQPLRDHFVLAIFPPGEDRASLSSILENPSWQLWFTRTFSETQNALAGGSVAVVLSEGHLPDGHCWRDVLQHLQDMPDPAPLIVADRLADETLWAEVLNLGGYDVLSKPFVPGEVLYAVTAAWRFRADRQAGITRMPPPS